MEETEPTATETAADETDDGDEKDKLTDLDGKAIVQLQSRLTQTGSNKSISKKLKKCWTFESPRNISTGLSISEETDGFQTELFRAIKLGDTNRIIQLQSKNIEDWKWHWKDNKHPLRYCAVKGTSETFAVLAGYFVHILEDETKKKELIRSFILESRFIKDLIEENESNRIVDALKTIAKVLRIDLLDKQHAILHMACKANRVEIIKWLMQEKKTEFYQLVEVSSEQQTPIMICAKNGASKSLKLILRFSCKKKSVLNKKNSDGFTAMHIAAYEGFSDIVKVLIEQGASVEKQNRDRHNPLRTAINCRKSEVIRVILQSKGSFFEISSSTFHENGNVQLNQIFVYSNM